MRQNPKASATSAAILPAQGASGDAPVAYCPDLEQWPASWMVEARDLPPGQQMVECFKPFLRHLLSSNLSAKTLRKHRDNLWQLGGEIISDLHDSPRLRKRPMAQEARSPTRSSSRASARPAGARSISTTHRSSMSHSPKTRAPA